MKWQRGYYDFFVRTCAKFSSSTAVRIYDNGAYKSYTYSELYGVCEYISQNLHQLQCYKGVIGLVSERNIIIPCVIAAAHKFCTTFMFIDPSQDIETLANDINLTTIISIKHKDNNEADELFGKQPDKVISVFDLTVNLYMRMPNQDHRHVYQHSFIAMTSGSTGEPKHVQVPIQCIQPNIDDLTKMFNISPHDIIYFSTPLTFDPSMIEILLACINGASLLIAPEKADILFSENKENSITFWQTTPSRFFQFSDADIKNRILCTNSSLKVLALGGEPLNGVKRLKELKDMDNKTKIFTLYGVTEMSCWACAAELDLNRILTDREVPLGNCLSETEVVVEPPKNNLNSGKIVLVSKTRNCFILNKSNGREEQNSLKFVDTGDFGEIRNGTIYYRGRKDDIIKRFGNKVSLQLIESTIMQCPRVKTCSCIWLPNPMLLVVYFSSENLNSQELSDYLKCKLDDKHWPDKIVRVDNLPTNKHGKTSKQMISKMYDRLLNVPETEEPLTQQLLKELNITLCRNYTYEQINNKNFFSLGGTSFLAVSMCNKLSLVCPQMSNSILPYIMSQKHTIGEILSMAEKIGGTKPKKRIKRSRSIVERFNDGASSIKKSSTIGSNYNPIDFTVVWAFDTGKCVDASPTLFQTGLNVFVTVGSHSGKVIVMDAISGMLQGTINVKSRIEAPVLCHSESLSSCGVVGTYDGTIVCFTLEHSKEIWRTNVGAMIKSKACCCNGLLYVAAYDGNVRCLDIKTGAVKRTIHICDQAISADLVEAKDEYVLLGTLSGECASVHAASGAVAWRGMLSSPVFASPVLYDRDKYVVFAETGAVKRTIHICDQAISADLVEAKDEYVLLGTLSGECASVHAASGAVAWRGMLSSPVFASPVLYDRDKYVVFAEVKGEIHCRTVEKGIKIWRYQNAKGNIFSSLYIKPVDKLKWQMVFGCYDDKVYSINIKNFQPSLHWKADMTSPVYCTPCGLSDKLILACSNNGRLCAIESENGGILADYQLPNEAFSSPATHGDYIFIGCRDDHLYSLKCTINM